MGAAVRAQTPPRTVYFPSARPTGDADVDRIEAVYYPAGQPNAPAVLLLPPIGESAHNPFLRHIAQFAVRNGISALAVTLPYHGRRHPRNERRGEPALHYLSGDPERAKAAFAQAESDAETALDWLSAQPGVDRTRVGVVGMSLGAIIGHLAMGRDSRISAGVLMLGGGDLADIGRRSWFTRIIQFLHPAQRRPDHLSNAEFEKIIRDEDPLTLADRNRPRKVLMVQAARDEVVPSRDGAALWNALGRPPIRWIDSNHFALRLAVDSGCDAALSFLRYTWAGGDPAAYDPPRLSVPTIKFGLIAQSGGRDSLGVTPALTYQLAGFGSRSDHMAVGHADVGVTGRGLFLGAAVTLTRYADFGVASRLTGGGPIPAPRPYLGLHVAF